MKRVFCLYLAAIIFCCITPSAAQMSKDNQQVFILLSSSHSDTLEYVIQKIEKWGGHIVHIYPPHVLIGYLESTMDVELNSQSELRIFRDVIDSSTLNTYGNDVINAAFAWNNNFMNMARANGLEVEPTTSPQPVANCILEVSSKRTNRLQSKLDKPQGAGFYDNSEFLYGSISINVILVESTGNGENWSATRETNVVSEIQAAMNWWYNRDTRANLSFTYHFIYGRTDSRAQTSYEPITMTSFDEELWITEIMENFGYTHTGYYDDAVYGYVNDKIDSDNTNWGVLVFVVDDLNDSDNMFPNGYFAYAFSLGGPHFVMTYDNDGYGIANMDAVTAHEFGHIFYARDEYAPSGDDCNAYSGYLNVQNRNSLVGGCPDLGLACIMRGQITPYASGSVCSYSRETVGWRDSDGDNIFDIVDTHPNTFLNTFSPDPTYSKMPYYYSGTAAEVPLNNLNPLGAGNDISVNPLTSVQYRVDGGIWQNASGTENYDFFALAATSPYWGDGLHTIEARAQNSQSNSDLSPASDQLTTQAHLRSNSALASASNNQRKLAYTSYAPAKFHLVYEDVGEIYYTFSTDNGTTWSNEILLSSSDGNNKYPSIAAYQNKIYVIWQRTTSTNTYTIYVRRYTGSSWAGRQTLGSASLTTGNNPLPVITLKEVYVGGAYKIRTLAVWKGASALRFRTSDNDGATWATEASVPNTSSTTKNPSLSAGLFFDRAYQGAYLAYDDGSLIRLATYSTSWAISETPPGSITSYANASHVMAGAYENPNGHAHVAWQGVDPVSGLEGVFYQRKSGIDGSWSAVQSYVDDGYRLPVITHLASNNLAMYWDRFGLVYKATYTYSTNSWSVSQNFASGQYPTLSAAFGSTHPSGKSAYVVNSSAPYKVQIGTETLQKGMESNGAYSRRVAVADTTGAIFLIDVGNVYFRTKSGNSKPLSFVAVDDTLLTLPLEEYWNYLETQPASITNDEDSLIAEINVYAQNPKNLLVAGTNAMSLSFEIMNSDSAKAIANLGNTLTFDKSGNAAFRLAGKISSLAGKNISLRPALQGLAKTRQDFYYSLIHVHYDDEFKKPAAPGSPAAPELERITAYQLHQNYPNPFNPRTTLRFDLPEAGHVSLKVFDLLGNEVMTLVEEDKNAGVHRVELDGVKLQSGVYLCRLQAGSSTQTIKVTLLK